MAIKVTPSGGGAAQIIPNAKEILAKIKSTAYCSSNPPPYPVTRVGGVTGSVGNKVTIYTDNNDVSLMFATSNTGNVIFGYGIYAESNSFGTPKTGFHVVSWTGGSVTNGPRDSRKELLGDRRIVCVHDDSGKPVFRSDQTASGSTGLTGISLLQL